MFRTSSPRPRNQKIVLSAHSHDDLGLAVANTLASIRPASARSSAPSTASASAPATPPSKSRRHLRHPPRPASLPQQHRHGPALSHQPDARHMHQLRRRAQQGHRRRQRLRPRRRNPPARRHRQPAHLRDHDAAIGRRPHDSLVLGKHCGRRALEHRLIALGHNLAHEDSTPSTIASPTGRPQENHLRPGPHPPAKPEPKVFRCLGIG